MTRTRKILTGLGALAVTLAVPAGLVLATGGPASACTLIASGPRQPLCGGGSGNTLTITASPSTTAPGEPVTLTTALVGIGVHTDLTASTQFSMAGGSCTANVCSSPLPGVHTATGRYTDVGGSGATLTTTVTVLVPDHLVVSPVYTTAVAGQTIRYTISRAAVDGTRIDDVSSRATVTLGGAPCPGAVCTATTAGQQVLTANLDGMTAGGAVMVSAGPATSLVVTKRPQLVWDNVYSAAFSAKAVDAVGNNLGDVTNQATFSITPDGACTHYVCSVTSGGSHTVTATSGALSGSVTLNADGPIPTIAPTLPSGEVGVPYSAATLSFQDANTTAHPGSDLPPGLSLSLDGVLSGTPTAAGSYSFYVAAGNLNGSQSMPTTITIDPAPAPAPTPSVSAVGTNVLEGNAGRKTAPVVIVLSAASSTPVTVAWHTANGTAVAGKDYVAGHGTVTIPAGQLTATVPVSVIGDTVKERSETFAVVLTGPDGATLGTARGIVTIANDD
jgi:hypothetical protein